MLGIKKISRLLGFASLAFCASGILSTSFLTENNKAIAYKSNSINQNVTSYTKLNGVLKVSYKKSLNPTAQKVLEYMKEQKRYELLVTTI